MCSTSCDGCPAVSAEANITYKILFNEAVAMTGGQPIDGALSISHLVQQLSGEGVERIALVSDQPDQYRGQFSGVAGFSLHHRDELDTLQKALRDYSGCSVLIYQQACAAEVCLFALVSVLDRSKGTWCVCRQERLAFACAGSSLLWLLQNVSYTHMPARFPGHGPHSTMSCLHGSANAPASE